MRTTLVNGVIDFLNWLFVKKSENARKSCQRAYGKLFGVIGRGRYATDRSEKKHQAQPSLQGQPNHRFQVRTPPAPSNVLFFREILAVFARASAEIQEEILLKELWEAGAVEEGRISTAIILKAVK